MRVVVLGTGTGVGKTRVTCDLVRGLQAPEHPVLALKPVETGFAASDDGRPTPDSDAAQLEAVALHVKHLRPHPLYAFRDGISPHLAAERAERPVELEALRDWVTQAAQQAAPGNPLTTLVETAGGVFSPLGPKARNHDLASAIQADLWLLVAPDRLGVLHDVAATLSAMTTRGRGPDCLVLVPPSARDASTGSNARELQRLHPELKVIAHDTATAPGASELVSWIAAQPAR